MKSMSAHFFDLDNNLVTPDSIHGPWCDPTYPNSSGFDPYFNVTYYLPPMHSTTTWRRTLLPKAVIFYINTINKPNTIQLLYRPNNHTVLEIMSDIKPFNVV